MTNTVNDSEIDFNKNVAVEYNVEVENDFLYTDKTFAMKNLNDNAKHHVIDTVKKAGILISDGSAATESIIAARAADVSYIQALHFRPFHIMGLHLNGMQLFDSEKSVTALYKADKNNPITISFADFILSQLNNSDIHAPFYVPVSNYVPEEEPVVQDKLNVIVENNTVKITDEEGVEKTVDEIKVYKFEYEKVQSYSSDIRAYTDYKGYFIDKEFLLNLSKGEGTFVSVHEILHNFLLHDIRTMTHPVFDKYKKMMSYARNVYDRYKKGIIDDSYFHSSRWINFNQAFDAEKALVNTALDQPINDIITEEFEHGSTGSKINFDRLHKINDKFRSYIQELGKSENDYVPYPLTLLESFLGSFVYESSIRGYTSEESYEFFNKKTKRQKKKSQSMNIDVHMVGGMPGSGDKQEDHKGVREERERVVKEIAERYKQIGGRSDSFSKWYQKYLDEKSKVDYRVILRNHIMNIFKSRPSWSKLNRRMLPFDIYRPGIKGDHVAINFAADTSGSMDGYIEMCIPEMEKIVKTFGSYEINFFAIDTDICGQVTFNQNKPFSYDKIKEYIKGGGGTRYDALFDHLRKTKNTNPLFFLTDFGVYLPKKAPIPNNVTWLAPESTLKYKDDDQFLWGKIIMLPDVKK